MSALEPRPKVGDLLAVVYFGSPTRLARVSYMTPSGQIAIGSTRFMADGYRIGVQASSGKGYVRWPTPEDERVEREARVLDRVRRVAWEHAEPETRKTVLDMLGIIVEMP